MKYFISAGEASGDLHAAQVMAALARRDSNATFEFLGGEKMKQASGQDPLIHIDDMSVMGFGEVIRRLPRIFRQLKKTKDAIATMKPDAVVLVDYPSFNLKIAKYAKSLGLKVFWYVSPKVWVWKEHRVKALKQWVDRMYCILPFEVDWYKDRHDWDVSYVGNPSAEEIKALTFPTDKDARETFLHKYKLTSARPLMALLPGSRVKEIKSNLPIMVEVARRFPHFAPAIATVPGITRTLYDSLRDGIQLVDDTYDLLHYSEAALVTSGTATLETALLKVPQVMMYRHSGSRLMYALFRRFLKVDWFSLPNLINDKESVSELVMHFCTPDAVSARFAEIIPGGAHHNRQQKDYELLRERLGDSEPSVKVAEDILKRMKN